MVDDGVQPRDDPSFREGKRVERAGHRLRRRHELHAFLIRHTFQRVQDEFTGIPDLVRKVTVGREPVHVEVQVLPRGGAGGEGESECVAALFVDDVERIHHVAQGFGHLASFLVPHQAVEEDGVERELARHAVRHHDHARHPEEEDVVPGFHHLRGEEFGHVLRLFVRPPERGERPEPGGEPGVQDILFLVQYHVFAVR